MRTRKTALALLAGIALIGAACGGDDSSTDTDAPSTDAPSTDAPSTDAPSTDAPSTDAPTTTEAPLPERGDADLVIWADDTRVPILTPIAEEFGAAEGLKVVVQEVPSQRIRDNVSTAGPAGEGPDIYVGAHDWLGELVANGAVAPLELGAAADEYLDVAINAFTYEGQIYGLPYAIENIALIRNTDLVPEAPATWAELEEIALGLVESGDADIPLAVQGTPDASPYHFMPLFTGSGGYLFGTTDAGFDTSDVGLDSEGGITAAQNIAGWFESGLLSKDIDYGVMIDSFGSGRAPFALTGPWAVAQADNGFEAMGVPFVVEPVPPIEEGITPQVFVGVQGFMLSPYSENADLAKTFVLDYLNSEELQLALYEVGARPPAMASAFEQVADDPIVAGFGAAGEAGMPMPAFPVMSFVFTTWGDAYQLIASGTDPEQAMTDAATAIRAEIG
ncbi:MAG: extracellular solute-binding protein [Actinomycetota bacterium]|nr:MAG: extracellular solute-binding protein [Actinomycetota bacterium]